MADIPCPNCRELNEPGREFCWKCFGRMDGKRLPVSVPLPNESAPSAPLPTASRVPGVVWLAVPPLACVAVLSWKFGFKFLRQFFISPFPIFIVIPWALASFAVQRGMMTMKRGKAIYRDAEPVSFWMIVGFYFVIGTVWFILNLRISWSVAVHNH